MLHWLNRVGLRLWRSCCYPFQRIAALLGGNSKGRLPPARPFPKRRVAAVRDGGLMLPEDPAVVDLLPAEEFSGAAFSVLSEHNDGESLDQQASSELDGFAPFWDSSTVLDPPASLGNPRRLGKQAPRRIKSGLTPQQERELPAPPFDWILKHRLAIGPLPKKAWLQSFEGQGIRTIISLCSESEGQLPKVLTARFRCVRVPLPDSRYRRSLTLSELEEVVDLIHWNLQKRQPVYLHCLAGIERSPLVAIAYLCRYCSMDLLDATGWLAHVHGRSRPLPAQLKIVRQYLQQGEA